MEKVFDLDKKNLQRASLPQLYGFFIIALYALIMFVMDYKFDSFFIVMTLHINTQQAVGVFMDFDKVIINDDEIKTSSARSIKWTEIDWSISQISDKFIGLFKLEQTWKNPVLISPQYFLKMMKLSRA